MWERNGTVLCGNKIEPITAQLKHLELSEIQAGDKFKYSQGELLGSLGYVRLGYCECAGCKVTQVHYRSG